MCYVVGAEAKDRTMRKVNRRDTIGFGGQENGYNRFEEVKGKDAIGS